MFATRLLSVVGLASVAFADGLVGSEEYDKLYSEWAYFFGEGMELEDYTWEAHEVTTSSGYIKTLFHITGDKRKPDYKPSR